jgi:hypothetical protein
MKKLSRILKDKKSFWIAFGVAAVYFVFYLWSLQNLIILPATLSWSIDILDNWTELLFRSRVAFLWEPIGAIYFGGGLTFMIAPLNIVLGGFLSVLVFLNILVAVYSFGLAKVCNVKPGAHGLVGILPGLLTGFACCAPTFVIALGAVASSFTVFFIAIRSFLIPVSVLLMIWGYWFVLKKITIGLIDQYDRRKKKTVLASGS